MDAPLLAYVHLVKNGGTSFRQLLADQHGENFHSFPLFGRRDSRGQPKTIWSLDEDISLFISDLQRRQMLHAFASDVPYGVHEFLDRPVRYISFLRDPVSRCTSFWYNTYKLRTVTPLWNRFESVNFDFDEIVRREYTFCLSNDQTRTIAGSDSKTIGEADFARAVEFIKNRYFLVGSIRLYSKCVQYLSDHGLLHSPELPRLNVTDQTIGAQAPEPNEARILYHNRWDAKLYDWLESEYLPSLGIRK